MRTLRIDLADRAEPDDRDRRMWHAHAARMMSLDGAEWGVRFGPPAEGEEADAVLTAPATSWVHWTALFAFLEKGVPCRGPGGLDLSFRNSPDAEKKTVPCISFDANMDIGFDEGDACDPWDVFAVRADPKVSSRICLILSALFSKNRHASLPEMAGEAVGFYDRPEALFDPPAQ
jgi:hypothetical protein